MEYVVAIAADATAARAATSSLSELDPAALVDVDPGTGALRVATVLNTSELHSALRAAGLAIGPRAVKAQPSTCCGGCGG